MDILVEVDRLVSERPDNRFESAKARKAFTHPLMSSGALHSMTASAGGIFSVRYTRAFQKTDAQ